MPRHPAAPRVELNPASRAASSDEAKRFQLLNLAFIASFFSLFYFSLRVFYSALAHFRPDMNYLTISSCVDAISQGCL